MKFRKTLTWRDGRMCECTLSQSVGDTEFGVHFVTPDRREETAEAIWLHRRMIREKVARAVGVPTEYDVIVRMANAAFALPEKRENTTASTADLIAACGDFSEFPWVGEPVIEEEPTMPEKRDE